MALYTIGDLHLSFSTEKPMDIFGIKWEDHSEKIKENWLNKVTDEDTVILPGDFSWATYIKDSVEDFRYLNSLPGKKVLLKGNHDYWWSTVSSMNKFIKENNFSNIYFLYNNSYKFENKIIVGTRGWVNSWKSEENYKILKRENDRLKLSIKAGLKLKESDDEEMIAFIHYPPFYKENELPEEIDFIKTLKDNNISKCYYAHLHGESHKDAIEGIKDQVNFKLVSSDYLGFDLIEI